jgi:hypothetical protein
MKINEIVRNENVDIYLDSKPTRLSHVATSGKLHRFCPG